MKVFQTGLLVLLLTSGFVFAQGYDLRFVELQNDGATLRVTVQMQGFGGGYNLGSSNLVFAYNATALAYTDFTPLNFTSAPYIPITVTPSGNSLTINIVLFPPNTGFAVSSTWMEVASITFTMLNKNARSNLAWVSAGTTAFTDAFSPPVLLSQGVFTSLDSSLPVQLSLFRGQSTAAGVLLEWRTETEDNNLGFNLYRAGSSSNRYIKINQKLIAGAGSSTQSRNYAYTDDRLFEIGAYSYQLESVNVNGDRDTYATIHVLVENRVLPAHFYLDQNYPNPFNPSTAIQYGLPQAANVRVEVYNLRGELVRVLQNSGQSAGAYELIWDGRNSDGQTVPSGVYLYRLSAGNYIETRKMLFTK